MTGGFERSVISIIAAGGGGAEWWEKAKPAFSRPFVEYVKGGSSPTGSRAFIPA